MSPVKPSSAKQMASSTVVRLVFFALLIDLLAFTMPLPLFPRLINEFVTSEASSAATSATLLTHTLSFVRSLRNILFSFSPVVPSAATSARWDLTILGGILGSVFSFCQFLISPHLGSLSDKFGRRPVLLISMVGNLISGALWLFSSTFGIYAASRVVGGLSEGNVQMSIAVISDVTNSETRSKSLALVGVAFSLAFTLGPSLGAYFASQTMGIGSLVSIGGYEIQLNGYAVPAAVTLGLLTIETIFLALYLPETRWWKEGQEDTDDAKVSAETAVAGRTLEQRLQRLKDLQWLHLGFLFFFSGAEFTLTFLTYDLFAYSNAQNGKLLGFIGVLSSLLQGGYVRRRTSKPNGPSQLASAGMATCCVSLLLLALLPHAGAMGGMGSAASIVLYGASAGLAFVSATVVNSLNALASLECSSKVPSEGVIDKGRALGVFRSRGQLGRAFGPLVATGCYFVFGPSFAYFTTAMGAAVMAYKMRQLASLKDGKGAKAL